VEQFKYLGTKLTNQNSIYEEIRSKLKSGNGFYHSVQNLLFSSLLPITVNIKIYGITILPVVLYGCETWSLTLREECRLRMFGNGVLRGIYGSKRDEVTGECRKLHNEEFYALYLPNITRVIKARDGEWRGL
jgi:hypothetical protein